MKKAFGIILIAFIVSSCKEKAPYTDSTNDNSEVEAFSDSIHAKGDSIAQESADERSFAHADELFNDFLYDFVSNKVFQHKRILFPLKVYVDGRQTKSIQASQWKTEALHSNAEYSTSLYESERQRYLEKDTNLVQADFEWIDLNTERITQYHFEKNSHKKWFLNCIRFMSLESHQNSDFYSFYKRFIADSLFQRSHVLNPVDFITYDEENSNERIEGTVDVDQWFVFHPELPSGRIANLSYGQTFHRHKQRVLVVIGNSNSMQCLFTFRWENGQWHLAKFEN